MAKDPNEIASEYSRRERGAKDGPQPGYQPPYGTVLIRQSAEWPVTNPDVIVMPVAEWPGWFMFESRDGTVTYRQVSKDAYLQFVPASDEGE